MSDTEKWDYFVVHINFEGQNKTNSEKSQQSRERFGFI